MQLYCKNGVVLARHDDGQAVPASAYGAGVAIVPYSGQLSDLDRVGDAPPDGSPDLRPYAAPSGVAVPQSLSRAQAKIALHRAGLLDMVKTAVAADPEVQIWFDDALTWERTNPNVVAMGEGLLGLTPADIDALFVQGAQITA